MLIDICVVLTHSIYVLYTPCRAVGPMALECEVVFWILRVDVVDRHTTFNAAKGKASGCTRLLVRKYADAAVLQNT